LTQEISFSKSARVVKTVDDDQLVFGWAWISEDSGGELVKDSDGESILPEDLEPAVYDFVLTTRNAGEGHEGPPLGRMVESLVLTKEKVEAMGMTGPHVTGWWVGFQIEDADAFARVKSGEHTMFSIEGIAEAVES